MLWLIALVIPLGLLLYWLFVSSEGTYLGAKTVELLYDWTAPKYDNIKNVNPVADAWLLAEPLIGGLGPGQDHRVLDVATGTGRLPFSLLRQFNFDAHIVGLDRSTEMLQEASRKDGDTRRVTWIRGDAESLPFPDGVFDAVTCLEAMEFFPHPHVALREIIRVLKPNGLMLVSNRIGRDSWLLPGRHAGRGRMERLMATMALEEITPRRWQVHYDLIWSRKSGAEPSAGE